MGCWRRLVRVSFGFVSFSLGEVLESGEVCLMRGARRNATHRRKVCIRTGRVALLQTPFPAVLRCRSVWTFFMDCICRASPLRPLGKSKVSPVDVTGHWSVPLTLPAATLWLRVCPFIVRCNELAALQRAQRRPCTNKGCIPPCRPTHVLKR